MTATTGAATADRRAIIAACALTLALTACSGGNNREPAGSPTAVNSSAVRTDAAPITKRFPTLGEPTALHWQGAAAGSDSGGVPGPTDVRIQALIELSPEVTTAVQNDFPFKPATDAPNVSVPLQPFAPEKPDWLESDAFTRQVCTSSYNGTILLDPASRTVWLDVIGG